MAIQQLVITVCFLQTLTITSALTKCSKPAEGKFGEAYCSTLATDNGFDVPFPPMDYLDKIGRDQGTNDHLTCIAEGSEETGKFLVVYDCDLRIPVYTLTKLTEQAACSKSDRGTVCIKRSLLVSRADQASHEDYKESSKRTPCYVEKTALDTLVKEENWCTLVDDEVKDECCKPVEGAVDVPKGNCSKPPKIKECLSPIDRGHLMAYKYLGSEGEITDVYTNIVPQFSRFNRGVWRAIEGKIVKFAKACYKQEGNGSVYVYTGAVPSTYDGKVFGTEYEERWLGRHGFGNDKFVPEVSFNVKAVLDDKPFRINVPTALLTHASCLKDDLSIANAQSHAALNLPQSADKSFENSDMLEEVLK